MRTVVVEGQGRIRVDTVEDPVLPDERGAILAVEASAICGSDLHFYDGDLPFYPVAVGHEAIGTLTRVGSQVTGFSVGDRVLVSSVAGCGRCPGCATRDPIACHEGAKVFGSGELGGAQSDLLAVPQADFQLLHIPEGVDDEAALLLTDNLATGWAAVSRAEIPAGGTVVILGLGAVGQCALRCALARGVGRVLAYDPVPGRLARAEALGAEALPVDGPVDGDVDVAAAVLAATDGVGADAVIDAVASDTTLETAFACVRAGGTISVVGIHDLEPFPLNVLMGVFRSITLRMTTAPVQAAWDELVPLIRSGQLRTEGVFTHSFALEDAATAYAAVADRSGDCVKAMLRLRHG